jgi:(p)ppGpp synthase/HD superfamily hydrolase
LEQYNRTYLSRQALVGRIIDSLSPVDMNLVLSAYEMSEHIHEFQKSLDGAPYFWHITRVTKILIDELHIIDSELICSSLLLDALEDSDILTPEVLTFNFGPYVAYLIETLTKNFKLKGESKICESKEYLEKLKNSCIDCLIIKLADRLDNFRCLEFGMKENPIKYIDETFDEYIPIAKKFDDEKLKILIKLLKTEKARYFN